MCELKWDWDHDPYKNFVFTPTTYRRSWFVTDMGISSMEKSKSTVIKVENDANLFENEWNTDKSWTYQTS